MSAAPARTELPAPEIFAELEGPELQPGRGRWLIALFIALAALLHFLTFENPWVRRLGWFSPFPAQRMEVQQVDPAKLAEIRRRWAKERQSLLLSKNQPRSETAPEDARYFSDRNIRVKKEQRARDQAILPKEGGQGRKAHSRSKSHLPSLGNLGVQIPLQGDPIPENNGSGNDPTHRRDQALLDKSVPEGGENLLNAQESVYYSFYARIYEEIGPLWQSLVSSLEQNGLRIQQGEYSTLVDVVLDGEGNLVDVRRVQASGVPDFDRVVDEAWRKISRFPNPPRDLLKQGEVHTGWTFTVTVNPGVGVQFLPPERKY